jgi:hypothetical protein
VIELGLGDIANSSVEESLGSQTFTAKRSDEHDWYIGPPPAYFVDQFKSVHFRHAEVGHDEVNRLILHDSYGLESVACIGHLHPFLLFQESTDKTTFHTGIVNNK